MRWLRTQRDLIGLIAVWGLLLQSLAIPFSSGLHAAAFAADARFALICTTRGLGTAPDTPSERQSDCPCSMACHAGCAAPCGELRGTTLAALADDRTIGPAFDAPAYAGEAKRRGKNGPRAPPAPWTQMS